jgi:2'-hydroxyisoflavone reductase
VRVARGGKVLVPGPKEPRKAFTTFVDVRDCAEFAVRCVADGHGGTYNVTGPEGLLTFDEMVDACKACTSKPVEFVPAPEPFLMEHGVAPWMGLPLWLPEDPQFAGAGTVSRARAVAAGCTFRPLADTVRDTLAWWAKERKDAFPFGAKPGAPGLSLEREAELVGKLG